MASLRKSERLISSRGHGCLTVSLPQLPPTATTFPSHGSGRPQLELRTATKLSSVGFEPTAILTFGLRVRGLNQSATCSLTIFFRQLVWHNPLVQHKELSNLAFKMLVNCNDKLCHCFYRNLKNVNPVEKMKSKQVIQMINKN